MHVNELVQVWPSDTSYVDALAIGVGEVLFSFSEGGPSLVWQLHWSPNITVVAVFPTNPTGTITNSDLKQAKVVMQFTVWASHFISRHKSLLTFNDNALVVLWSTQMAEKSAGPITGRSIRGLAYLCIQHIGVSQPYISCAWPSKFDGQLRVPVSPCIQRRIFCILHYPFLPAAQLLEACPANC